MSRHQRMEISVSPEQIERAKREEVETQIKAFIQGGLMGAAMRPDFLIKIKEVYQGYDKYGRYNDYFDITTESGIKIRVQLGVI